MLKDAKIDRVKWAGQVLEFPCVQHGLLYVGVPPDGVPLASALAQAISREVGARLPLPLDALLAAAPDALAPAAAAIVPIAARCGGIVFSCK